MSEMDEDMIAFMGDITVVETRIDEHDLGDFLDVVKRKKQSGESLNECEQHFWDIYDNFIQGSRQLVTPQQEVIPQQEDEFQQLVTPHEDEFQQLVTPQEDEFQQLVTPHEDEFQQQQEEEEEVDSVVALRVSGRKRGAMERFDPCVKKSRCLEEGVLHSAKFDDEPEKFETIYLLKDGTLEKWGHLESFEHLVEQTPDAEPFLLKAMGRCADAGGWKFTTKPVKIIGNAFKKGPTTLESTGLGEVIHQASNGFCVIFALLNVLLLAKGTALADYLYSLNSSSSNFSTLAVLVEKFSIQLKKVFDGQTIKWLIEQTKGKFLVEFGTHAISVDCKKRVLYDCGETYVLPLTLESFEHCGLKVINDLRQVYDRRKTI